MSSDFSQLKKLDIEIGKTTEYVIPEIDQSEPATLIVKPATESNKGFTNQVIRLAKRRPGRRNTTARSIVESREQDRDLYPKHVIVGWKNIHDSKGQEIEFKTDECKAFITALPDYLFDELRIFVSDVSNFIDEDEDDLTDEELGEPYQED